MAEEGVSRLDRVAQAFASGVSRRQALRQIGAALTGATGAIVLADPPAAHATGTCPAGKTLCPVCVSTSTSPQNCGACGNVCSFPNAAGLCVNSTCQIGSCHAGYANCDGNTGNGCETNLRTSVSNCGACGHACNTSNASSVKCTSGICTYTCFAGYGNCTGSGCTTNLTNDVNNCGACGAVCATGQSCVNGTCAGSGGSPAGAVCSANSQCASGICGVSGSGTHCCGSACTTGGPCGATDCGSSGACVYASASTVCGASMCSDATFTPAATCDGAGTCVTAGPVVCVPYACCGGTACCTACTSDIQCAVGFTCNTTTNTCG